jgi:hypothetical protein
LISQVDVGKCDVDIHCGSTVWEEILFGRVLTLEDLLREIDVGIEDVDGIVRGTAAAAWCLHGTGRGETASGDDANAGFVVHHFHEECTGRITDPIGKLGYIRKV